MASATSCLPNRDNRRARSSNKSGGRRKRADGGMGRGERERRKAWERDGKSRG